MSFVELKKIKIEKPKCGLFKRTSFFTEVEYREAFSTLSPNAFKLWCYYAMQKNNAVYSANAKDEMAAVGMKSASPFYRAFDELQENGYMKENDEIGRFGYVFSTTKL